MLLIGALDNVFKLIVAFLIGIPPTRARKCCTRFGKLPTNLRTLQPRITGRTPVTTVAMIKLDCQHVGVSHVPPDP